MLQEIKIIIKEISFAHGRELWFIPIQTTTKDYYNQVLRKFPIQITLIFQLVADHSETYNCSSPERKQFQMLQCTYFIPLFVILQLLLKCFPLLSFISKAAEQLAHS